MKDDIIKSKLLDIFILILITSIPLFSMENLERPVIALLLAIIFSAGILLTSAGILYSLLLVVLIMLSLVLPELTLFLPIYIYASVGKAKIYHLTGALALIPAHSLYNLQTGFLLVALCCIALSLASRGIKIDSLYREFITLRDSSTEWNMALKEKNKDLMEKQDYEVYLATLKERNRIAREIHDNVGHMLSRSILQIGALRTLYKDQPLSEHLISINDTLNQAMNSIRESVHDLHDESIDLRQAIFDATSDLQAKYNIHIDYDMSEAVPRNIKYSILTIIKEALSNIVKHSNATEVLLMLREHPGFFQLSIEDNGTLKKNNNGSGIGLTNMEDRVSTLGGTMNIRHEHGFCIFISIPKA